MSGVPVSLHISGDAVALELLADAVDGRLLQEMRAREAALESNEVNFASYWSGRAADAFATCCSELQHDFESKVSRFIASAGEVIRAYAWRIRRGKDTFADYADRASQAGLVVQSNHVLPPTPRAANDMSMPCSVTDVDPAIMRIPSPFEVFDEIALRVREWHEDHALWIMTYFGPLMQQADGASDISRLLDRFEVTEYDLFSSAIESAEHRALDRVAELLAQTAEHQTSVEQFERARHAGLYEVDGNGKLVGRDELQRGLQRVEKSLDNWRATQTVLRTAGPAATVVEAVTDVMNGGEYGEIAFGAAGSAAGAAAGARASYRFGIVGMIIGGGVGAGLGSSQGKSGWEVLGPTSGAHLQLGAREEILHRLTNPGQLTSDQPRQG